MTSTAEVAEIVKHLKRCDEAYYAGEPIISDAEYDSLRDHLKKLDPSNPYLKQVGAKSTGPWPKWKHKTLIGSLEKVNTKEEFDDWVKDKGDLFMVTHKGDGSTLVATYEKGKLVAVATRGDGEIGENITANGKLLPDVVHILPESFTGEIRGEAILRVPVWKKHFEPKGAKNPRNSATGKLRDQKDPTTLKLVEVMWFDIMPYDRDLATESDKFALLKKWKLKTIWHKEVSSSDEVWQIFEDHKAKTRASLDYEIDGLVVKMLDIEEQNAHGMTSNRPQGARAIKFPSMGGESKVKNVVAERGLTGRFCPVGIVDPINIGGVTIERISLHNYDNITRLGIDIGDYVWVERANDVIPQITKKTRSGPNPIKIFPPRMCPECKSDLARDGAYLICPNQECQGDVYGSLMTWIRELNILGIGPSLLRELISNGCTDLAKLYKAKPETFFKAAKSEKTGKKCYDALHQHDKVSLSKFLSGLNIQSLGTTNGQRFAKQFKTVDAVMAATVEDIQKIPGIQTTAAKIKKGLEAKAALINELKTILTIEDLDMSGPLAGKSFCVTGELSKPRNEVHDWIKAHGGEVKSSVSKDLTYLVTNETTLTTKMKKAKEYGTQIINEDQLNALVTS
jgi:DNA ligase (NAD+)